MHKDDSSGIVRSDREMDTTWVSITKRTGKTWWMPTMEYSAAIRISGLDLCCPINLSAMMAVHIYVHCSTWESLATGGNLM